MDVKAGTRQNMWKPEKCIRQILYEKAKETQRTAVTTVAK
jgi:hypothetical protein